MRSSGISPCGRSARISADPPAKPGRGRGTGRGPSRPALRSGSGVGSVGCRGLVLVAEDLLRRTALEQLHELLGVDRLALEQEVRDPVEVLAVLGQQVLGGLVGLLDDAADLVVDLARDLVRVVGLGGELAAEEGQRAVVAEDAGAEALGHPVAHHHLLRRLGHLLEVVGGAGGDLAEDDLLRGAAAERHRHRVAELGAGGEELVLARERDRVAERLAAADDRDLVDRVAVGEQVADDRVAHLVEGGDQALLLRHHPGLLLGAGDHAHDPFLELVLADLALARARGQQGRLVDQVGEVGAGEAGRLAGERVEVDLPSPAACRACGPRGSSCARGGRAGRRRSGGRSGPDAAAPGRGCRAGWWPRSG